MISELFAPLMLCRTAYVHHLCYHFFLRVRQYSILALNVYFVQLVQPYGWGWTLRTSYWLLFCCVRKKIPIVFMISSFAGMSFSMGNYLVGVLFAHHYILFEKWLTVGGRSIFWHRILLQIIYMVISCMLAKWSIAEVSLWIWVLVVKKKKRKKKALCWY